jgi:hypothetical protein
MNENFERFFLDEWWYIPLMVVAWLWSFGIGMLIGTVLIYTL